MKTSIFDMNFVLPPMVEMTEVVKEMPSLISRLSHPCVFGPFNCNQGTAAWYC